MLEAREEARFLDEADHAGAIGLGMVRRQRRDRLLVAPHGVRRREVLLDRDVTVQDLVEREVDDAEAAFAEHANDLELADLRARRQRLADRLGLAARGRGDRRLPGVLLVFQP
jgi:hypothetical protein